MKLKILSWNIWVDGHFDNIADFLRQSQADIIGLQEVKSDDPDRDVIGYLESLGYKSIFTPIKHEWRGEIYYDGPAIFSKHKILASQVHILSETYSRAAVKADIQIGSEILHFVSTHLLHTHQEPSDIQNLQTYNLLKLLPGTRTVVVGDFNATPDSIAIKRMRESFADTDPASLPTWSVYPAGCSICNPQSLDIRLDYIFTSKDLKTNSFKVESSQGSDHLPISVIVEI